MKKIYNILLFVILSSSFVFAEETVLPPASKPDIELTKDEAVLRIQDFQIKNKALEGQIIKIDAKIVKAESNLKNTNQALIDCDKKILNMLGIMEADITAYRQKLGVIEGNVRKMQGWNDDRLADAQAKVNGLRDQLNELRTHKISLIPEFYNKIIALAKDIRGLWREKKIKSYTVGTWAKDRDCLWNISAKDGIYGDAMLWPKIWQINKDIVKNPDVIFPGQVLQLPPKAEKTSDEMKSERRYWRNKKAAASETGESK